MRQVIRRLIVVTGALLTILLTSSCFVTPIEQNQPPSPTSNLRDGPQTATLPSSDVAPIAANPTPQLPVTVNSQRFGQVTVTDVSRIVAVDINGTLGSIVYSLGLGPSMVGRDSSTTFASAAALPVVTNRGHSLNAESVLALNPSILLVDENTVPQGAVEQIRNSGVAVVVFPGTRSLAANDALIRSVAQALGVPAEGDHLAARTSEQVDAAKRLVPSPSGEPTIAFLYIRGKNLLLLAGPGSGADDLIKSLGGKDAGEQAQLTGAFTQITAEAMIKADPNVILVMTQGADTVGGPDGVLELPGIAETDAGRSRRVVSMDESKMLAFGPDVGEVIAALAQAIYK